MTKFTPLSLCIVVQFVASGALGEVRFFDMGTADSKVYTDAIRVTADDVYSRSKGYGWKSPEGLTAQARVYEEMGDRRGSPAPPVMWTNAITEDCIIGETENAFLVDVPDGDYCVYLLCGTSDSYRYFYWDFAVVARDAANPATSDDGTTGRVQMEGGQQHRPVRLKVTATSGRLQIDLKPQSRWVVSCLLIASEDEWQRVEREIIHPLEQWTFFLPPHVQ